MLNRITLLLVLSLTSISADDWPQYLGPQRDAVWRESGVELNFSTRPPKLLWKRPLGGGYSGPAVSGGRVFVVDRRGKPVESVRLPKGKNPNGWAPKNWSIENEMVFGQRKETIDEEEASHDRADHPHLAGS